MYAQVEKSKGNKSRAVANSVGHERINLKQRAGFVDNRPESVAQRRLQTNLYISKNVHQMVESKAARNWRRFKRWLSGKTLPIHTYRWDTRPAETIAQVGFMPWDNNGNVSLKEHVNNSSDVDGHAVKHESQWVSTGAFGMIKKIDPTFAQQVLDTNLYKINTAIAENHSNHSFLDVNKHFDSIGVERPYASQREWAMETDGIVSQAVEAWMTGQNYINQYNIAAGELTVDEADLAGWNQMPNP